MSHIEQMSRPTADRIAAAMEPPRAPSTVARREHPAPSREIRLLLLEDDGELRERILVPGLRDYGFGAAGVGTAEALYARLREDAVDVVVLDVGLPDADGFSVAQAVRAMLPGVGIVMLTGQGEISDQVRGLSQGADAYLVKPACVELLAATVRSVARRTQDAHPPSPPRRHWHYDAHDWCMVSPAGRMVPLTRTEQKLVSRLCDDLGRLVTREQLIAALTQDVHDFDPHRIEMIVHRLRRKVMSRCEEALPLTSVHGKGYVLDAGAAMG